MTRAEPHPRLVVFADDWGRHPSSCQHLVGRLVDRLDVLWVNTIGTRPPRLSLEDVGKAVGRLRQWLGSKPAGGDARPSPVSVISPKMWPGFRRNWQRRLNARQIARAVDRALGPRQPGRQRVAVTTLPIMADVVGRIDVDRWVYYCVDDFSVWPGLDGEVMQRMERLLVERVDAHIAVSATLVEHLTELGARPSLLTHGIDLDHWTASPPSGLPDWCPAPGPVLLFWGLIDQRLNVDWCKAVAGVDLGTGPATLVLVGPRQSPDPAIDALPNVVTPGPVDYDQLPALASAADVLVMPYRDVPVTRAMQPLKFKEYLATGKSVVGSMLPAAEPWRDAADLVDSADGFVEAIRCRLNGPTPEQIAARRRLNGESWDSKADQFHQTLLGD